MTLKSVSFIPGIMGKNKNSGIKLLHRCGVLDTVVNLTKPPFSNWKNRDNNNIENAYSTFKIINKMCVCVCVCLYVCVCVCEVTRIVPGRVNSQ